MLSVEWLKTYCLILRKGSYELVSSTMQRQLRDSVLHSVSASVWQSNCIILVTLANNYTKAKMYGSADSSRKEAQSSGQRILKECVWQHSSASQKQWSTCIDKTGQWRSQSVSISESVRMDVAPRGKETQTSKKRPVVMDRFSQNTAVHTGSLLYSVGSRPYLCLLYWNIQKIVSSKSAINQPFLDILFIEDTGFKWERITTFHNTSMDKHSMLFCS